MLKIVTKFDMKDLRGFRGNLGACFNRPGSPLVHVVVVLKHVDCSLGTMSEVCVTGGRKINIVCGGSFKAL